MFSEQLSSNKLRPANNGKISPGTCENNSLHLEKELRRICDGAKATPACVNNGNSLNEKTFEIIQPSIENTSGRNSLPIKIRVLDKKMLQCLKIKKIRRNRAELCMAASKRPRVRLNLAPTSLIADETFEASVLPEQGTLIEVRAELATVEEYMITPTVTEAPYVYQHNPIDEYFIDLTLSFDEVQDHFGKSSSQSNCNRFVHRASISQDPPRPDSKPQSTSPQSSFDFTTIETSVSSQEGSSTSQNQISQSNTLSTSHKLVRQLAAHCRYLSQVGSSQQPSVQESLIWTNQTNLLRKNEIHQLISKSIYCASRLLHSVRWFMSWKLNFDHHIEYIKFKMSEHGVVVIHPKLYECGNTMVKYFGADIINVLKSIDIDNFDVSVILDTMKSVFTREGYCVTSLGICTTIWHMIKQLKAECDTPLSTKFLTSVSDYMQGNGTQPQQDCEVLLSSGKFQRGRCFQTISELEQSNLSQLLSNNKKKGTNRSAASTINYNTAFLGDENSDTISEFEHEEACSHCDDNEASQSEGINKDRPKCILCGRTAKYLCVCRGVMYCCGNCQEKDWVDHSTICIWKKY